MAASHTKLFSSDDGAFAFHAAAGARPNLPVPGGGGHPNLPVLPEEKGAGARVSTRAGIAAVARERRARCLMPVADEPAHAEGLLLSPQQLNNVFKGLSNNTLSGL
eukprot:scaffold75253_cov44-Phaeocystis_antarctica.AAC.2